MKSKSLKKKLHPQENNYFKERVKAKEDLEVDI